MPFNWTDAAEKALLLFAIKAADVKPNVEIWEEVAQKLGPEANANGCSQKFYKLKREAEALLSGTAGNAPATPAGKKGKTATPKSTGGRKRTKKQADDEDLEEDDPTVDATPSKAKRAKKETKKSVKKEEPAVKEEEDAEDTNGAAEESVDHDDGEQD